MIDAPYITSDEKFRYQLDLQAHQIETVLDHHCIPGSVSSGTVRQRIVEFDVQAPLSAGLERMRGLKDSMMSALGVRDLSVTKHGGRWRLEVGRDYDPPVPLAGLLARLDALPAGTAAIGLSDNNQPVLLRFGPDEVRHVLVTGDGGAGKTTLLRTIAAGLALMNRQCDVQLLLIEGGSKQHSSESGPSRLWSPLAYLPHNMTDVVTGQDVGAEVLRFLVGEMTYRRKQRVRLPRIIVLIDDAMSLLDPGDRQVVDDVLRLLQHGSAHGIHLVMATNRPDSAVLDVLFMSNLSMKLVGKLGNPALGKRVMGPDQSQAEYLRGAGEFIAVTDSQRTYFQVADIGDYDLHWELNRLLNSGRPRLLAQPFDSRPAIEVENAVPFGSQAFTRENGVQWTSNQVVVPGDQSGQANTSVVSVTGSVGG